SKRDWSSDVCSSDLKGDSPEIGDQWVFVAIDADTKLIPAFHIGKRHLVDTRTFLWDLYGRIKGRTQITTDGLNHYRAGVPETFRSEERRVGKELTDR